MVRSCYFLTSSLLNAYAALRQAANKLPTVMEFIDRKAPPRLGSLLLTSEAEEASDATPSPTSS
jgi:hypothetical protein